MLKRFKALLEPEDPMSVRLRDRELRAIEAETDEHPVINPELAIPPVPDFTVEVEPGLSVEREA